MLYMDLKVDQEIVIGEGERAVTLMVVDIVNWRRNKVKLGFAAARDVQIHRAEIQKIIKQKEGAK